MDSSYAALPTTVKPANYFLQARPEMMAFVPVAERLLDLGCGAGVFGAALRQCHRVQEVWGVERDATAAAFARRVLDQVLEADILEAFAQLPRASFQVVVANDVLEHLVDPYQVVRSLPTLLTDGGVVVCSLPNVRYLPTLWALVVRREWRYAEEGVLDATHLRFFTASSIRQLFLDAGYEIQQLVGINPIVSWKFTCFNLLTFGFFHDTRYLQFAVVATPRRPATTV